MIDAEVLRRDEARQLISSTRRAAPSSTSTRAIAALDRGTLAGLGLDVLPGRAGAARLACSLAHPRAILTPHAAFYSVEAERELRRKAAQNIVTWLATGRPDYVVVRGTRKP